MIAMNITMWIIIIPNFLIMSLMGQINIEQSQTNMLFNTWYLETYKIEGKDYPPIKKEKGDYILFNEDMTFVSKSEGKEENGTFMLNTNGAYVLMIDDNGERVKAYIVSISERSLILKYDIIEISDVEVLYNSTNLIH
jgi:hypothetical protein